MYQRRRPPIPLGPWLVVGLRRSGAAAARALWARSEAVVCVDSGAPPEAEELRAQGMEVWTGVEGLVELNRARAVVKSPGVPREAPVIAEARRRGVTVYGELELGWRLVERPFVAVTGTNGKTTTAELLGAIWRASGRPVDVAGNVGLAVSALAADRRSEATVICEASSFQLEDTVAFAPEVALMLNVQPDHLDRHGTFEDYLAAKLKIFARQGPDDIAIGPPQLLAQAGGRARRVTFGPHWDVDLALRDGVITWQGADLMRASDVRIRGEHNLENAMGAAAAALSAGIEPDAVCEGLRSFPGVEHRIEDVADLDGVLWVNDSKATNVASTSVALDAFAAPVHLILGGQGKGQDFAPLRDAVAIHARAVYLIGEDAGAIEQALDDAADLVRCGDLEHAVAAAQAAAVAGEVVLLSPACASFDQYPGGYEERGAHFKALVATLAVSRPPA